MVGKMNGLNKADPGDVAWKEREKCPEDLCVTASLLIAQ